MKKLFFRFDFSPKIKKFLTTLHNTGTGYFMDNQAVSSLSFSEALPALRQTSSLRKFYP